MKQVVYRHADKFAIIRLLKEIGAVRLSRECEQKHLPQPKRVRLFYLEANHSCTFLKYKYQQGAQVVMKVDEFQLPETGWTRFESRG